MKKKLFSILLVLVLLVQIIPITSLAYPTPELGAQDGTSKFAAGIPMGVAHRAAWRDGPECSLIAIAASINIGIDVAELDVKLTKDGVVVLSHDSTINRCVAGYTGNISSYTWDELKAMPLEPNQGGTDKTYTLTEVDAELLNSLPHYAEHSGEAVAGGTMPLTRLDDAIDLIKALGPNTMVNLDHCFSQELFVACYVLFRETGMLGNVFFKNSVSASTMNGWYQAAAEAWNAKYSEDSITAAEVQDSILYVYIIHDADYAILQSHLDNGDNLVMTEICIGDDAADAAIHEKLEPWCKENGVAMFVNTMWSGLCSTKADTETTWAEMLDRGYVAIQTDQASELAAYLHDYNRIRASSETIQAEHFNLFNYEDYGFSVAESCDSNMNKKVSGMTSGDWMSYKMSFTGDEAIINLELQGLDDSAEVNVYLDAVSEENLIATVRPGVSTTYQTVTAEMTGTVTAGEHTLYIQTMGLPGRKLVNVDSFSFISGASFEGEVSIAPVSVTTEPGAAPELPGTVTVTVNGSTYGLSVRWEQIQPESYAQEGTFTVLGYISVLKSYTTATVTVVEGGEIQANISEDGLVLWLDASEGVTAENGAVTAWASKVGDITATERNGSPTLVDNATGNRAGIRFDGNDCMNIVMAEDFWNGKSEFTVLLYTAPEMATSGASSGTASQYNSIVYFPESASWGSLYFTTSQNEIIWRFGSGTSGDYGTTYVRPANIGNLYTGTAIRKDGTEDTLFVDGVQIYSGYAASDTTKNIESAGYIGVGKSNNYFKGTICEILIYDRALSNAEILAAQMALAEKYADPVASIEEVSVTTKAGKAPELPKSVQVTYASGHTTALGVSWEDIDPNCYLSAGTFTVQGTLVSGDAVVATVTVTEVPAGSTAGVTTDGLMIWLNSSEGVSTDENGKVQSWASKVGSYFATSTITTDATIDGATYVPPTAERNGITVQKNAVNGNPALVFDGDGDMLQMVLESDALIGLTESTVIVYAASETPVNSAGKANLYQNVQCHTLLAANETGGWGSFYTSIYSDAIGARVGNGTSKNYGFYQMRDEATTGYTTTVVRWEDGLYNVDVNGEDFGETTEAKTAASTRIDDILWIGAGKPSDKAEDKTAPTYWTGSVCEILIYDRALTDEELDDVYDYLAETYEPREEKVSTDGLMFWLDASKGVTVDENGNVQSWASKVGDAEAVYKKGDTALITDPLTGQPAMEFDGYEDVLMMTLDSGAFNGLTGVTVIAYAASNTAVDTGDLNYNCQRNTLFTVDEDGSWGSVYVGVYKNAISARFGTGVSQDRGVVTERAEQLTDYSTTVIRWDGSTLAYDVDVDGVDFTTGASKGSSTGNNKNIVYLGTGKENTYWNGTLCELLFYDRALTNAELETVYDYLNAKYSVEEPETKQVTGIYLKEAGQQLDVYPGDTQPLTASTVPADADNTTLVWTSSNPSVASVDENGVVNALKVGYAVITVTTEDGGYEKSCVIHVQEPQEQTLWTDIQNMIEWAEAQDPEHYNNWDVMEDALEATKDVTEDSSLEELLEAYQTLRDALLSLEVHNHVLTKVEYKAPTCTEPGNKEYYVCTCGKWYLDAEAAQEITDQASVIIAALGHSVSDWVCTQEKHWKDCACGEKFEEAAHTDEDGDGKCDVCTYQLPAAEEETPSGGNETPPTGDSSQILLMVLMLMVSSAAMVLFAVRKREYVDR